MTTPGRYTRLGAVVAALGLIGAVPSAAASQSLLGIAAASGQFKAYGPNAAAVTYDHNAVPLGAKLLTFNLNSASGTSVVLAVGGLAPSRQYGAHVHTKPCGPNPADSGGHYQNMPDPKQPSSDPAYANNRNEIWLDFTTDAQGNGLITSTVDWQITDARHPRSVVIHEHHTHTGGGAGARLACMAVPF